MVALKPAPMHSLKTPFLTAQTTTQCVSGVVFRPQKGARYLNPQTGLWLSTDPAMGEYVPQAPINDDAKKANQNLPGMGGVFNVVNLHVYHYAGNNPVKYTDPDGRNLDYDVQNKTINCDFTIDDLDKAYYASSKTINLDGTYTYNKVVATDKVTGIKYTFNNISELGDYIHSNSVVNLDTLLNFIGVSSSILSLSDNSGIRMLGNGVGVLLTVKDVGVFVMSAYQDGIMDAIYAHGFDIIIDGVGLLGGPPGVTISILYTIGKIAGPVIGSWFYQSVKGMSNIKIDMYNEYLEDMYGPDIYEDGRAMPRW
jgi:hypothetical protein